MERCLPESEETRSLANIVHDELLCSYAHCHSDLDASVSVPDNTYASCSNAFPQAINNNNNSSIGFGVVSHELCCVL